VDLPHGHPTTMSSFNQTLVQKSTKVSAPCVEAKNHLVHLLRILPFGFIHVLRGRTLSISRSIFCIATSFVSIIILVMVMGEKLNIVVT